MKKLLALLLALMLLLTFAACGTKDDEDDNKKDKESTSDSAKDDGDKDNDKDDDKDDDKEDDKEDSKSNTYETPFQLAVTFRNSKTFSESGNLAILNGFCEDEMNKLMKAVGGTYTEEDFYDVIDNYKSEYGEDYKFSYEITDKTKLDKDDIEAYQDEFRTCAADATEYIDAIADFDDEDWEALAEVFELDVAASKKAVNIIKDIQAILEDCKVTEGYNVNFSFIASGSNLEEDEVNENEVDVIKINGRWVAASDVDDVAAMVSLLESAFSML